MPGKDDVGVDTDAVADATADALEDAVTAAEGVGFADAVSDGIGARADGAVDTATAEVDGTLSFCTFSAQLATPSTAIQATVVR